jgi:hypothetical protein
MLKKMLGTAIVLALAGALPAQATTVAIAPDRTWHAFDVSDVLSNDMGVEWFDINNGEALSFTIDVAAGQAVMLTVVDAGYAGDRFQVFDNDAPIGLTSAIDPNGNGLNVDLNFDWALDSRQFSYGFFVLGEGSHTITGLLSQSSLDALNSTVGAISAAPVPLPASVLLLFSGGGLMSLFTRRRKTAA